MNVANFCANLHKISPSLYPMKRLLPTRLPKKATIGIVSPASPQRDKSLLDKGIRYLEGLGYTVRLGDNALAEYGGYLAGTDQQRASDIEKMFADPSINAIFCARGGFGCARILPLLNYGLIRRNPKIFVGFSDITALQLALWHKCRLVTFSGAMPSVEMANKFDPESEEQFWRLITSARPLGKLKQKNPLQTIQPGQASGLLLGGNLSVLCSLIGTPYMPSLRGSILTLEDVGEETYRIDRLLTQLGMATARSRPSGIAYGYWSQDARPHSNTAPRDVEELILEKSLLTRGPIVGGLQYGHEAIKHTLPFGIGARLSTKTHSITIVEPAVCV